MISCSDCSLLHSFSIFLPYLPVLVSSDFPPPLSFLSNAIITRQFFRSSNWLGLSWKPILSRRSEITGDKAKSRETERRYLTVIRPNRVSSESVPLTLTHHTCPMQPTPTLFSSTLIFYSWFRFSYLKFFYLFAFSKLGKFFPIRELFALLRYIYTSVYFVYLAKCQKQYHHLQKGYCAIHSPLVVSPTLPHCHLFRTHRYSHFHQPLIIASPFLHIFTFPNVALPISHYNQPPTSSLRPAHLIIILFHSLTFSSFRRLDKPLLLPKSMLFFYRFLWLNYWLIVRPLMSMRRVYRWLLTHVYAIRYKKRDQK